MPTISSTVVKWTRRLGLAALALLAIAAILWAISRALYPTEEQRDALAVMQRPAPPEGNNAFAALWTLDRAVPMEDMPRVLKRDAARIAGLPQFPDADGTGTFDFASAARQYPDLAPSTGDRDLFCNHERDDCLDKVATDIPAYRALVERNRELLDRIDALADYDYVRQQLPWHMSASIPVPIRAGLSSTRHALWFIDGRVDDALHASCRAIDTWRRLGASGDTLILRLLANAHAARNYGKLLAEMLARLPVDHALPPSCDRALAPPSPWELSTCTAMRGEFELIETTTPAMLEEANDPLFSMLALRIGYNVKASQAALAEGLAPICSDGEIQRIAADDPEIERPAPENHSIWGFECIGNYIGCAITSIAATAPAYDSYRLRMQDFGARLELLATLAWLRENADRPDRLDGLLDLRPDALKSPTRQVEIGENGESLRIRMFVDFEGETWSVPLPVSLQR